MSEFFQKPFGKSHIMHSWLPSSFTKKKLILPHFPLSYHVNKPHCTTLTSLSLPFITTLLHTTSSLFSDTRHQCYCNSETSLLSQRLPFYFAFFLNFTAHFLGCFHLPPTPLIFWSMQGCSRKWVFGSLKFVTFVDLMFDAWSFFILVLFIFFRSPFLWIWSIWQMGLVIPLCFVLSSLKRIFQLLRTITTLILFLFEFGFLHTSKAEMVYFLVNCVLFWLMFGSLCYAVKELEGGKENKNCWFDWFKIIWKQDDHWCAPIYDAKQ